MLKDIAFSDRAAINLKMKKKSMLKPVGHVTGGGGVDDDGEAKWLGELFSMFVAPKMQVLVTGKGNNWGKSYTIETGNLISEFTAKSSAASNLYGDTPFGTAKIPAERYFDNTSASASVNTVRKLGEFGKLGITADYTDEDNRTVNSESISYNNGSDPDIGFNETVRSRPHSREAKLNINVEHNAPGATSPTNSPSKAISLTIAIRFSTPATSANIRGRTTTHLPTHSMRQSAPATVSCRSNPTLP